MIAQTVDTGRKNFLTEAEMQSFLTAARERRHGTRDYLLALMAYRHGLRVTELISLRLSELDLESGRVYIRRQKGSLSTSQPMNGDEIRAIRAWLRERGATNSPLLFLSERGPMTRQAVNYLVAEIGRQAGLTVKVHPHMLRHSCGFALANRGCDTRLIQDYLGHRNIRHTQLYTRTAASRFEGLWNGPPISRQMPAAQPADARRRDAPRPEAAGWCVGEMGLRRLDEYVSRPRSRCGRGAYRLSYATPDQ